MKRELVVVDAVRRCLVCEWEDTCVEPEETDVIGPPCPRCRAPTERVSMVVRCVKPPAPNPNASALGRLGASRGGRARAAVLTPTRRREIARAAARARWSKASA
jgi:hypothetical protein